MLVYRSVRLDQWFPDSIALSHSNQEFLDLHRLRTFSRKCSQSTYLRKQMKPNQIDGPFTFSRNISLGFPTSIPPQLFFPEDFIHLQTKPNTLEISSEKHHLILGSPQQRHPTKHLCFLVWAAPRIPATATQKRTMSCQSEPALLHWNYNQHLFRASRKLKRPEFHQSSANKSTAASFA